MDQRACPTSSFPSEREVQRGSSPRELTSPFPVDPDPRHTFPSDQSRLRSYSTTAAPLPILPNPQQLISTSPPRSRFTTRPTSYQGPPADFRHFASTYPAQSRSRPPSPLARNLQHGPNNIASHSKRPITTPLPPLAAFVQSVEQEPYATPCPEHEGFVSSAWTIS